MVSRILVVDDEAHVRSMIAATLERQGYDVLLASGGREALDALENESFELILTYIVMQEGNGLALLERIHAQNPNLPVIMVTAIHDISVAIDSMRRGAYDYLLKPFEREHLVATVQRALENRQALQESRTYQQNLEQVVRARTEILRKAGKLTPEEQDVMREHCARGYQMLRKIPFLAEAAEIVFTHQEHYDGSGYPSALKSSAIPIGARIFAVADTLDAITSDRPYRVARTFDAAREEIIRCSGTQFDPAVVEVYLKIPNELWLELRSEITGQNRHFSTFDIAHPLGSPR